jgi:hypothetical protein
VGQAYKRVWRCRRCIKYVVGRNKNKKGSLWKYGTGQRRRFCRSTGTVGSRGLKDERQHMRHPQSFRTSSQQYVGAKYSEIVIDSITLKTAICAGTAKLSAFALVSTPQSPAVYTFQWANGPAQGSHGFCFVRQPPVSSSSILSSLLPIQVR